MDGIYDIPNKNPYFFVTTEPNLMGFYNPSIAYCQKGASWQKEESQKGVIAAQRCSVENQKGAIAVQSQWQ